MCKIRGDLGDPKLTRDIIDNIQNKKKYTSGVIALRKKKCLVEMSG